MDNFLNPIFSLLITIACLLLGLYIYLFKGTWMFNESYFPKKKERINITVKDSVESSDVGETENEGTECDRVSNTDEDEGTEDEGTECDRVSNTDEDEGTEDEGTENEDTDEEDTEEVADENTDKITDKITDNTMDDVMDDAMDLQFIELLLKMQD